jgi:hypothetical protein
LDDGVTIGDAAAAPGERVGLRDNDARIIRRDRA